MDLGGWVSGEDLTGVYGKGTIIGIYFKKKNVFSIKIVDYLHLRKDICDNVVNENKIILKQI